MLDLSDEATMVQATDRIAAAGDALDLVFVATGILYDGTSVQPEKTWCALGPDVLRRAFDINCIGPALVTAL